MAIIAIRELAVNTRGIYRFIRPVRFRSWLCRLLGRRLGDRCQRRPIGWLMPGKRAVLGVRSYRLDRLPTAAVIDSRPQISSSYEAL